MGGEDREHRLYSPSQMERISLCPGSVELNKRAPARETSKYAIEGTKAHDVLEAALRNNVRRALEAHREYSSVCMEDFDSDFYYSLQVALNYIYDILDDYPDAELYIEKFVDPPCPSAPGETGGYCDVAIFIPSLAWLIILDYKHGAGVAKQAKGNTQVKQYGAGFLFQDNPVVDPEAVDKVTLVIAQPRAFHTDGHIREYDTTPFELYEYLDEMDGYVRAALAPNAPLNPGEDQCRFCNARTICPAREAAGLQTAVNVHFASIYDVKAPEIPNPKLMDVARLEYIAQAAPMLRKFLDDVDAHLEELLRGGVELQNFKLVDTQAKRQWHGDENKIAFQLAALADVDISEVYRTQLITITDAQRMVVEAFKSRVGRGHKKQAAEEANIAMAQLTLKQSSGTLKMVPMDDPAPAVNRAARDFEGIGGLLTPPQIQHN